MKVVSEGVSCVKFGALLPGQVFGIGEAVHMALVPTGNFNAVNVRTGRLTWMEPLIPVVPYYEACVNLKGV